MKNPKLLILVGAPGSGKTTFATYHLRTEENWFRVSRDDFRMMQFTQGNLEPEDERKLTKIVTDCVSTALNQKMNVILDATHTREKYINEVISSFEYKADISFKTFDVSLDELKERCKSRKEKTGKHIPEKVLERQFNNMQLLNKRFDFSDRPRKNRKQVEYRAAQDLPKALICDLDGTLALMNGRNPFDAVNCINDLPNTPVINMVKNYHQLGFTIILLSGRNDLYKEQTIAWLKQFDIPYKQLVMRKNKDYRKDSIVKKEFFEQHVQGKYDVEVILDDRNQVVDLWREELKLPCFQVYYGDF